MPACGADALGALIFGVAHGLIPLVHAAVGVTVGGIVVEAVFLDGAVVRLCGAAIDPRADVQVLLEPCL